MKSQLERLCRIHTERNIATLLEIAEDLEHHPRDRTRAVEVLLSYGHGKPVDRLAIAQVGDGTQEAVDMTTKQIVEALTSAIPPQGALKREGMVQVQAPEEILENSDIDVIQDVDKVEKVKEPMYAGHIRFKKPRKKK